MSKRTEVGDVEAGSNSPDNLDRFKPSFPNQFDALFRKSAVNQVSQSSQDLQTDSSSFVVETIQDKLLPNIVPSVVGKFFEPDNFLLIILIEQNRLFCCTCFKF